MSATHRTYPALESPWGARFFAKANNISSFQTLVAKFVEFQASLSDSGTWAGYSYLSFTSITATYFLPNASTEALSAFDAIATFAEMHADEMSLNLSIQAFPSFQAWRKYVYRCAEAGASCTDRTGDYVVLASRLLPKDLLQSDGGAEVAAAFVEILGTGVDTIIGHLVAGRAVAKTEVDNAVNPAWRTALWHVIVVDNAVNPAW
ncbi:hypothetical protein GOP47_0003424, partial [Adiantum capillus-veneris]